MSCYQYCCCCFFWNGTYNRYFHINLSNRGNCGEENGCSPRKLSRWSWLINVYRHLGVCLDCIKSSLVQSRTRVHQYKLCDYLKLRKFPEEKKYQNLWNSIHRQWIFHNSVLYSFPPNLPSLTLVRERRGKSMGYRYGFFNILIPSKSLYNMHRFWTRLPS